MANKCYYNMSIKWFDWCEILLQRMSYYLGKDNNRRQL